MGRKRKEKPTAVTHLYLAKAKLLAVRSNLKRFGDAAGEDPKSLERVQGALYLVEEALNTLSASEDGPSVEQEVIPF